MKRFVTFMLALSLAVLLGDTGAFAQGRGTRPAKQPGPDRRETTATRTARPDGEGKGSRIEHNPQMKQRLTAMLPPNMTLQQAQSGFKNDGQFIAALHVSKDLGIPFTSLKSEMTGPNAKSLGEAVHDLKPELT